MTTQVLPVAFKYVTNGEVLFVNAARYQNSLPFSGAFEVFDLDYSLKQTEDGRLIATVNCTTEGVPLTEDSVLDIEVLGHYEGSIGYEGEVISCIAVSPAPEAEKA